MHKMVCAWGMGSMSSSCQFVHHFLSCSGVPGLFKVSFSSLKMAVVIKLTFLCPAFESDHLEAQKSLVSKHWDAA